MAVGGNESYEGSVPAASGTGPKNLAKNMGDGYVTAPAAPYRDPAPIRVDPSLAGPAGVTPPGAQDKGTGGGGSAQPGVIAKPTSPLAAPPSVRPSGQSRGAHAVSGQPHADMPDHI